MPASLDLIGRGWAFPLGVDARGGIALAEGEEEIRQAILLIVRTRRGARVMRPEFGCRIWELLFGPNDASTWTMAGHHVREALGWWEPRIEVDDVRAAPDPGNPAAMEIEEMEDVAIFSAGTDGTDGPTDAAGAVADGGTMARARALGMEARDYLEANDSYRFFEALGDLVKTGPTGNPASVVFRHMSNRVGPPVA